MHEQPLSPQALSAFTELYPRLLALVRERIGLELNYRNLEYDLRCREFLEDFSKRFGDTLKAVYAFGLFEHLEKETAWLVSVLESRARGWAEKILETWTIAIQGMVKPPEADELSRPLIRARSLVARLSGQPLAEEKNLPQDVQRYLDFCLRGQRREAAEFALAFLEAGLAPEKIADGLLLPALIQTGMLWEKGRIGASTEHLATEITRYVIYRLFDSLPRKEKAPFSAVLACVPGDEHDIGIDLMANLLRSEGWSSIFIGRSSPHRDLLETVASARPDVVVLSVSLVSYLPAAHALISDLREKIPSARIILGGAAALTAKHILGPLVAGIAASFEDGRRITRGLVGRHA